MNYFVCLLLSYSFNYINISVLFDNALSSRLIIILRDLFFSSTHTRPFTELRPDSEPKRLSLDLLDCQADAFLFLEVGP